VDGIASAAGYAAALIAVTAGVIIAARASRSSRSAIRRYLAAALISIGVATAVATPETRAQTRPLDVLPNLVGLIGDLFAVGAAFCVLAMLTHAVARPDHVRPRVRRQATILIAAVLAMILLLALSATHTTITVASSYALDPFMAGYELLYLVAMCWGMSNFLWLVRRYLSQDDNDRLRQVLRINTAAAAVGLVWAAWKLFTLVAMHVGLRLVDHAAVSELLAALLVTLIGVGCTLPAWAEWLSTHADLVGTRRALTNLEPLWRTLTTAVPGVTLPDADPHTATLEYALYRRIIEIHDAQMALRSFIHPDVPYRARRAARRRGVPTGQDTDVIVEAAELAAALHAHRAGQQHQANTEPALGAPTPKAAARISSCRRAEDGPSELLQPTQPVNMCAEVYWLIKVSRALFSSPIITEVLNNGPSGESLCSELR
jgi:hypothetical protein